MQGIKSGLSTESGFTLIEVLIGISIFAIGILAVARMQMISVKNTSLGNLTSQATMLAHQKMEEIKTATDFDTMVNEVENNIDEEGNAGGIYNRTTTITVPAGDLGTHARQVQVQVQWQHAYGGNRTVEINSLTYERWVP